MLSILAGLALGSLASPAAGDTLLVPAPGGVNLTAGAGYMAWAHADPNGLWRLLIRGSDGLTSDAPIPSFGAAPDPAIGRYRGRLVVTYSRCAGVSAFKNCDIFVYDIGARIEHRVRGLATHSHSETAPSLDLKGRWSFVRRDGTHPGIYMMNGNGPPRRLSSHIPLETVVTPSYVVAIDPHPYKPNPEGVYGISALRRHGDAESRNARIGFGYPIGPPPHAAMLAGGRIFWLQSPGVANSTIPLDPNGRGHRDVTSPALRALPATTNSLASSNGSTVDLYLDADGIKRIAKSQPLFAKLGG